MSIKKSGGPQFIRFLYPIIEVIREFGGSGTSSEVTDKVIERLKIPEKEQSIILKSGQSRVYNQVHWARMYLVSGGILDSSKRGVWTLTEEGNSLDLNCKNLPSELRSKILCSLLSRSKNHHQQGAIWHLMRANRN